MSLINHSNDSIIQSHRHRPPIRVVYMKNPPDAYDTCRYFPTLAPSVNCPFPGWTLEILSSILDGLGLESRYLVGNVKYPVNTSNAWPGATGYLYNDTADVIGVFYQRTPPRESAFSFSYPLTYVQPLFATKAIHRKKTGGLYDNFSPFEWSVWGCLLASLLSLTLVFSLIVKVELIMKKRDIDMGMFQIFWGTISTQLGEADEFFLFPSISGHMLFAFLTVFLSGIVMWAYEGYVIYSLLKPAALFPFTQEEMFKYLATKKYTLIVPSAQHWLTEFINNSDSEFYRKLRTSLKNNPWIEGKSHDVLTLLAKGKHIYFSQEDDEMMIEVQQLCGITTNSMGLGQASAHFILQKKSRFLTSFNTEIIRQQSFIHRTQTKYFESGFKLTKKVKRCPPIDPLAEETLSLSDMLGVFYLVAIGLAAAILAFFVEFIVFRWAEFLMPNTYLTTPEKETIVKAREKGISRAVVSDLFKCDPSTVSRIG